MKSFFKKLTITLLVVALCVVSLLYFMQEKLIFLPTQLPQDYQYEFTQPFEEFSLATEDGALLNAIHFKSKSPKGVILYFHGNAGDLSRWGVITQYFTQYNYDVVVMDYRTYGKSTGELSETLLYNDANLFYEHVNKQFPEDQIIVYGRSLGTTFASYVASKHQPSQLILETPFYNLTQIAQKRFPILPVKKLLKYKFPTHSFVKTIQSPTTIFHGTDDSVVPYASGKKLYELFKPDQGQLITIENGTHNNLIDFEAYRANIAKLLK
ncbi:alpha/beta hydrolase [Patiriisocius hiemis]|uniref:Alpha/beta fold hydrolase n=1 Tax=Patiriisocius hiemis TaxID=3075604 RepID=A0ABU2Y9P5_9FLAO|nr:alpha/beta fold hydrolase [Constantimarinum sp. W242]MDT0554904.1 alpha/beta fold hydrolase [Constantimarinum sp. W242]